MDQTFMKERKIIPLVLSMSLPMVLSMLVNSLYNIVDSYFVAKVSEDAMTALSLVYPVQIVVTAISVGFGVGPFPRMGMSGAALATGIGQTLTLICYIVIYILRPIPARISLRDMHMDSALIGKLYSIGIPATLNMALPSLLISALNGILSTFGEAYVLVLGAYYKLQTFIYLPVNGIIQGIRPLVGYNYGAKEYRRVKNIFMTALIMAFAIMLLGLILSWSVPAALIGIFTANPATITIGVHAMHIISLGFIVSAISVTCCGALEGLSAGMPSLMISLLRYLIIMIPAALLLCRPFLSDGVWIAFPVTEVMTAIIAWAIYHVQTRKMFSVSRQ